MQLEILLNALHLIVARFIPAVVLVLSVMACACTVMLLHIDPKEEEQGCAFCAFIILAGTAIGAWGGGFVVFQLLEQLSEESAAVLGEIEKEIMSEAVELKCFHGGQRVRRSFAARLFRRRMLRVRIGEFRKIEAGFALEFFQMTADNIVSYIFMVSPAGHMWLL